MQIYTAPMNCAFAKLHESTLLKEAEQLLTNSGASNIHNYNGDLRYTNTQGITRTLHVRLDKNYNSYVNTEKLHRHLQSLKG